MEKCSSWLQTVGRADTDVEVGEVMSKLSKLEASRRELQNKLDDADTKAAQAAARAESDKRAAVCFDVVDLHGCNMHELAASTS